MQQAGVFVSSIDAIQFVKGWMKTIKVFVSYEIKSEQTPVKMMLNVGELDIDASTIFGVESEIGAGKVEIYKDLLAVTAVSTMVRMDVNFEKPPKINFQEFLKTRLKFIQLTSVQETAANVSSNVCLNQMSFKFSIFI